MYMHLRRMIYHRFATTQARHFAVQCLLLFANTNVHSGCVFFFFLNQRSFSLADGNFISLRQPAAGRIAS